MGNLWQLLLTVLFAALLANPVCCCAMTQPDQPASCCGSHEPAPGDHDCPCITDAPRIADENRDLSPAGLSVQSAADPEILQVPASLRAPRVLNLHHLLRPAGPPPLPREFTCRFLL